VADEGAVDVDERRDQPPPHGTDTAAMPPGARLSPLQQAWSRYVTHTTRCGDCRDVDRGRCATSERLYREYQDRGKAACDGLADT